MKSVSDKALALTSIIFYAAFAVVIRLLEGSGATRVSAS